MKHKYKNPKDFKIDHVRAGNRSYDLESLAVVDDSPSATLLRINRGKYFDDYSFIGVENYILAASKKGHSKGICSPIIHPHRGGHHFHGPSSLDKKATCPGFSSKKGETSEAAKEGTLLHEARENKNFTGLNEEQETCVLYALEEIDGLRTWLKSLTATDVRKGIEPTCWNEVTLEMLRSSYKSLYNFGTVDWFGISGDGKTAAVADTKFGKYPVAPAETNLQGWNYVLYLFDNFPMLENVMVRFISPRLGDKGITSHVFNRKSDYYRLREKIETVIHVAAFVAISGLEVAQAHDLLNATFICRFCEHKGICPARAQ